eukprot:CAMPEP_0172882876 /NCGR_PEP_ID=MMETSP1075-20121228/121281_1 /TAXON_ID=2916 /ORGANISM="Ceratium fusus, Strain PA161109" /LENGTH=61 /DNA_ID=CAMNT_0013735651 /DNA_START=16 /DNA_END=197 /DNA_ORIENTATION=-
MASPQAAPRYRRAPARGGLLVFGPQFRKAGTEQDRPNCAFDRLGSAAGTAIDLRSVLLVRR